MIMKRKFTLMRGWSSCPECGSTNVSNPYDYSYCHNCGANNS